MRVLVSDLGIPLVYTLQCYPLCCKNNTLINLKFNSFWLKTEMTSKEQYNLDNLHYSLELKEVSSNLEALWYFSENSEFYELNLITEKKIGVGR